jgi:tetratricopeptide (TPR) repeat protein
MLKPKLILTLFLFLLIFPLFPRDAYTEVTEGEIGRACVEALDDDAQNYYMGEIIPIQDNEGKKDLILLAARLSGSGDTALAALLRSPKGCDVVLRTAGRGINAKPKKGKGYPEIDTYFSEGLDEKTGELVTNNVTYFWNGSEYEDVTLKKRKANSKKQNEKALGLFKRGKIDEAIKIWEKAMQDGEVTNAETLTNLGFAYYTLGKKTNDTRYFSYDANDRKAKPTPYEEADRYLYAALVKEPKRWTTLLNIGDLYFENSDYALAIIHYEKLLKIKPDYRYADVIKKRIEELKQKPVEVGVETVVTRFRTGEKGTTYTRLDAKMVLRKSYFKDGTLQFLISYVEGHETGEYKSWFENGKLAVDGQKEDGKSVGKYTYYSPDGSISEIRTFKGDGSSVVETKENKK